MMIFGSILTTLLLTGCGSDDTAIEKTPSVNAIDYSEIIFHGVNTKGHAEASGYLEPTMFEELGLNVDSELDEPEIDAIHDALHYDFDKYENLSNGDEVTVTLRVDEEELEPYNIEVLPGEKVFTVENLEEPLILTSEAVEENLEIEFEGKNGEGRVYNIIDNFEEPLTTFNNIDFVIANEGHLSNGDMATVEVTEMLEDNLADQGYVLEDDFHPEFLVTDLKDYDYRK